MTENDQKSRLSYQNAGVDIDAGNELVERIKPAVKSTLRPEVMGSLGGFGALFELNNAKYRNPVLISGTDGVGTKLKLAMQLHKHDTIGIDLVAMCVNDILVQGAEPLFFLDYYATGKLDIDVAEKVISGIAQGCSLAGAALIGGETAEMPGMYQHGDYDLAGFCVGVAEKDELIDGLSVCPGDILIGLASSGLHSNGYSLVRKLIEIENVDLDMACGQNTLGEALLEPTRIYVKPILELLKTHKLKSIAHITGGGLTENLPRVLPEETQAVIDITQWPQLPVFDWLTSTGKIQPSEMYRTFNCSLGLVLCVPATEATQIIQKLNELGEQAYRIGYIETCSNPQNRVIFNSSA